MDVINPVLVFVLWAVFGAIMELIFSGITTCLKWVFYRIDNPKKKGRVFIYDAALDTLYWENT